MSEREKQTLRTEMLRLRKAMAPALRQKADDAIAEAVLRDPRFQHAAQNACKAFAFAPGVSGNDAVANKYDFLSHVALLPRPSRLMYRLLTMIILP